MEHVMNEETSDRLANLSADALEHLSEWLQATEAFVAEQAPLVAQEIVRWGMYKAILLMVLCAVLLALVVISTLMMRRLFDDEGDKNGATQFGMIIGTCVAGFTLAPGIYNLCYVLTAPRLYILEQISKLV
jgi:FtsH-binding integral membrane protein